MLSLNCKNVQHVKIYKKIPQLSMSDNCVKSYSSWKAFFFFFLTFTAFGYSNNQREATLTKCEVAKAKFWESLTFCFFTAMLITYINGWTPAQIFLERGLQWRGLHLLFFDRSYQVLLTDVVIIPRWAIQALVLVFFAGYWWIRRFPGLELTAAQHHPQLTKSSIVFI